MRGVADVVVPQLWRLLPKSTRRLWGARLHLWQLRGLITVPLSQVKTYVRNERLRTHLRDKEAITLETEQNLPTYTLICTTLNEENSIRSFLESVRRQQWGPRELVLVDGGSADSTCDVIRQWHTSQQSLPFILRLEVRRDLNIAQGRNIGVSLAQEPIVAFADAGCELEPDWAQLLLSPFAVSDETEVSMGYYQAYGTSALSRAMIPFLVSPLHEIDASSFLPSARSLAIRKDVFARTGGFPEFLTRAGEDTLFDFYLKSVAEHFAFVPEAQVVWRMPSGFFRIWRTIAGYAQGDAEAGKVSWAYYLSLTGAQFKIVFEMLFAALLFWMSGAFSVPILSWLSCGVLLNAIARYLGLILRYRPFASRGNDTSSCWARIVAVVLLTSAQGYGFLKGLSHRSRVEKARTLAGSAGHAVLLIPYLPIGVDTFQSNNQIEICLRTLLLSNYFVTVLYRDSRTPSEHPQERSQRHVPKLARPRLQHMRLETHQRGDFHFEEWKQKHRDTLGFEGREFLVIDFIDDSFSRASVREFVSSGAEVRDMVV